MGVLLNELLLRAGASDQDEDLWLAERQTGITATEIKSLMMSNLNAEELALLKLTPVSKKFEPNRFTEWGKAREPIIASYITEHINPNLILEHRVFKSKDNDRFLASPDMIGEQDGRLILAEIKTSKNDLSLTSQYFEKTGYNLQMQWQMYVCDASECLFAWERHKADWDSNGRARTVYPIESFIVERDDNLISEMKDVALEFLEKLDDLGKLFY